MIRKIVLGLAALASLVNVAVSTDASASRARLRIFGKGTTTQIVALRSQAMGATDANGFVVSFPLDTSNTAKQIWVDDVNGTDGATCNGLSPYSGYKMNGTGTNFQYGATGPASTPTPGWCPKKTFIDGYLLISANATARVGNQIFLVEGGTFLEGTSADALSYRSGASVAYPFTIQSYNRADPLNLALQGRATGTNRPKLGMDIPLVKMKGVTVSGDVMTVPTDGIAAEFVGGLPTSNSLNVESVSFGKLSNQDSIVYAGQTGTGVVFNFNTGRGLTGIYSTAPPTGAAAAGTAMYTRGQILRGQTLTSPSMIAGTQIIGQITSTAPGNVLYRSGTYRLNIPQTISTPEDVVAGGLGSTYKTIVYPTVDTTQPPAGSSIPRGNIAIRGIDFTNGSNDGVGISWVGNPYNVLFENVKAPGIGVGSSGALVANNIILRHVSVGRNFSSDGAHSAGLGTGHADGLVIEDSIIYHGGWAETPRRQLALFTGVVNGSGVLTVSGIDADIPILPGQSILSLGGGGNITAKISGTGGNGTYQTDITSAISSQGMETKDARSPDIFKQGLYMSYGSNDQSIVRRNIIVDNAASGLSGRGSIRAYHNVLIDNPVQMVAGGSVDDTSNTKVGDFTGSTSGNTLSVSGYTPVSPFPTIRIGDRLNGAGLITTNVGGANVYPTITVDLGGGSYTLSGNAQPTLTGVAMTTRRAGYAVENPSGADLNYDHNFILGSADITKYEVRNQGIGTQNGRPGSTASYNLFANNNNPDGVGYIMQSGALHNQPSYIDYSGNRAFAYGSTLENNGTPKFPAQLLTTYTVANTVSPTSPMTNTQFYAAMQALGYGDGTKAGMMTVIADAPEINWAYIMLGIAGPAFGHNFALGN